MNNKVTIRKFQEKDISKKVLWINDAENNQYLHYDLPLEYDKTLVWFQRTKDSTSRFDGVIEYDNQPVGLIGLLSIDAKNRKAEYYIAMGEREYKGKGIAKQASNLLLKYAFDELKLNKVYLMTEVENVAAQKLFERLGFQKEGMLKQDILRDGKLVDRFMYGILKEEFDEYSDSRVNFNKTK